MTEDQGAFKERVLITGATGGLGRALAARYAQRGAVLSLSGRNSREMEKTLELCSVRGAEARSALFDLRDRGELAAWIRGEDEFRPLDVVFANAGIVCGAGPDGLEDPDESRGVIEVNLSLAILTALEAAKLMLPRGRGRIVFISSLAAKVPLVNTPSYCASKAALKVYGLSLRESLAPRGIGVTVVCPGYIRSPMKERFQGFAPFAWEPGKAAERVIKKIQKNPAVVSFPLVMNVLSGAYALLPGFLKTPLNRKFSFKVGGKTPL
ncbi:MAG: SDR family NAD(P)-dependent oxidoreductase [Deltaproteobacteria bacterium]|nr:SDR family NAD(P)-dependent oxidoreductase [Deltaproteobacteria bacterium]